MTGDSSTGPAASEAKAPGFNVSVPNPARIYDYLLGGKDHYEADRAAADALLAAVPTARTSACENRAFLERAVRHLAGEAGIRQFIDIGTGMPAWGSVHEVAGEAGNCRVVYIDYDPIVTSHARALLAINPDRIVVEADLRNPDQLLADPGVRKLIDFSQPVALILGAVLHFVRDSENPVSIIETLTSTLPPGSYLALSHVTDDSVTDEVSQAAQDAYDGASAPAVPRTREAIAGFFNGTELVEPGLVPVEDWNLEERQVKPPPTHMLGGIGRIPEPG